MFIHIEILTLKILGTGEITQSIKCFHARISNWVYVFRTRAQTSKSRKGRDRRLLVAHWPQSLVQLVSFRLSEKSYLDIIWMTYFLHFSWLWFSVMVSICFKEKLLAERWILFTCGYQNVVRSSDSSIKWWVYVLPKDLWLNQPQMDWFLSYWVDFKYS